MHSVSRNDVAEGFFENRRMTTSDIAVEVERCGVWSDSNVEADEGAEIPGSIIQQFFCEGRLAGFVERYIPGSRCVGGGREEG